MQNGRMYLGIVALGAMLAGAAVAGTLVDQGAAHPAGSPWFTAPATCRSAADTVTSVGITNVNVPATALAGRRWIQVCNSAENAGSPLVKIRVDGTAPVMGATEPGLVLSVGDCASFALLASVNVRAISDTAATAVSATECR